MAIRTLFLDIGGVLLSNGWSPYVRQAAQTFGVDPEEVEARHDLTFAVYEEGKISLDEYLNRIVFYRERPFSREAFKDFMFSRSQPYPRMMELMRRLKHRYDLRVIAVSNEGKELALSRNRKFDLGALMDIFVYSYIVRSRKPDEGIFRVALEMAQQPPDQILYIDDQGLFVEIAIGMGIQGIHHTGYESTQATLGRMNYSV
jgi:putative hydrolase of the HAD superfamily